MGSPGTDPSCTTATAGATGWIPVSGRRTSRYQVAPVFKDRDSVTSFSTSRFDFYKLAPFDIETLIKSNIFFASYGFVFRKI